MQHNINLLINELTDIIDKQKEEEKKEKIRQELMIRFEEKINKVIHLTSLEFLKGYNILNIKIIFESLLKIIKNQEKDIIFLKNKLIS